MWGIERAQKKKDRERNSVQFLCSSLRSRYCFVLPFRVPRVYLYALDPNNSNGRIQERGGCSSCDAATGDQAHNNYHRIVARDGQTGEGIEVDR